MKLAQNYIEAYRRLQRAKADLEGARQRLQYGMYICDHYVLTLSDCEIKVTEVKEWK